MITTRKCVVFDLSYAETLYLADNPGYGENCSQNGELLKMVLPLSHRVPTASSNLPMTRIIISVFTVATCAL
jgi:hypothetical protein